MKKTQKWIIGSVLTIIIAFSGSIAAWFILSGNQPPSEDPTYPDLTVSNYLLENDILTITVTNIGNSSTPGVAVLVSISPGGHILYNNFESQEFMDVNEDFIIFINLTDFEEYLVPKTNYIIAVQIDLSENIDEISEDNNELLIDYYYEGEISPPFDLFEPNTYSFNSTIDTFAYAVQFNATQITIENSLTITNGTFNGYEVINSTILTNSTISGETESIAIALYGNQILNMQNIWDPRIHIFLGKNSSLSLYNSSIQELTIEGTGNILLWNSTVQLISSSTNITTSYSLNISNHSHVETCFITSPLSFEIEFSSFQSLYFIPLSIIGSQGDMYSQGGDMLIFGNIVYCSIANLYIYHLSNVDIYRTNVTQLNIMGKSRVNVVECIIDEEFVHHNSICILNNTRILDELNYGIKVYSDSVNITNGIIQGTSYESNVVLINADVFEMILQTVVVNNTGEVFLSNSSCNLYLYDSARATINESSLISKGDHGIYLQDSSKLTGINTSLSFVICQNNSSMDLNEDVNINILQINSTNDISIDHCIMDQVLWYSEPLGNHKAQIINSTIDTLVAPPSSRIDIIDCSIQSLRDGIRFQTGINYYNTTGSFGEGIISDYLNITDSTVSNRICDYIEVVGDTKVIIKDLHILLTILVESGNVTVNNCTISSIIMRNDAIAFLENCSSKDSGSFSIALPGISCYENSQIFINDTKIYNGFMIMLFNTTQASITNSVIYGVFLTEESRAFISYSELGVIRVTASSSAGYALTLSHSSTQDLLTFSWKAKVNLTLFLLLRF